MITFTVSMITFTEHEYAIMMSAIVKCHLLNSYVKAGVDVRLNPKNFGFAEMTDDEESALISKLHDASQIAWLKECRK
jgi:hypothetical protein